MPDVLCNDTMKIDPSVLRQLREERSWTQEHLAAVSGVSLRTIQRIEREGNASADSRLSLAAAFGVDVAILAGKTDSATVRNEGTVDPSPIPVDSARRASRSFQRHLLVYLVVGAFMVYGDLSDGQAHHWVQWPLMGWGLGLLLHGLSVWSRRSAHGFGGEQPLPDPSDARTFTRKVGIYLVMSVVFVAIDLQTTGGLTWAFYPILGWGAGLLLARRDLAKVSRT